MYEGSLFSTSSPAFIVCTFNVFECTHSDWYELTPHCSSFFFFLKIYLFVVLVGLSGCTWTSSSCRKWGLLFVVVCGPLIVVASLVVGHRLLVCELQ